MFLVLFKTMLLISISSSLSVQCIAGYYKDSVMTECTACDAGFAANEERSECGKKQSQFITILSRF